MQPAVSDLRELRNMVQQYFGTKGRYLATKRDEADLNRGSVRFSLYDSFVFSFVVAEFPFSSLAIVQHLPGEELSSRLLGVELRFIENDEGALVSAFDVVDRYCRLRLPDKYLTEFDIA
ncbi:hypothetical protein [Agromyces laixinhei]|uniref:hypothetical protein n=1 Tax=Agromyces laixinhei TaxID=2585717 RepID=UPI0012EE9B1A|nr:hypothetical protein [Agromyces laixinhei]